MVKRDRIFFLILGLVLANVSIWTAYAVSSLYHNPANLWYWARLIADVLTIIAILYLMRTYMKGRKTAKQREKELKDASE